MSDRRTTNILLAAIVALQIWQVLTSAAPVVASDAQNVALVEHSVRKYDPIPVIIVEK